MSAANRRTLWAGLAAAVALGGVWQFFPLRDASARLGRMPRLGSDFASRDVPLDPYEAALFNNVGTLKRVYQFGKQRFVFLAVDGSADRHAVHDPVYCFRGAGWQVVSQEELPIEGGVVKRMRLHRGERDTEVVSWFSDGVERHASALAYWRQATLRRLTLGRSGEEPVLVILQPLGACRLDWPSILKGFTALLSI